MIIKPDCNQMMSIALAELESLSSEMDAPQAVRLSMVITVLQFVAARTANQVDWSLTEIADIEGLAGDFCSRFGAEAGAVKYALNKLVAARQATSSSDIPVLTAQYELAGEVLSCCLELGVRHGGSARADAEALLTKRLERELQIRGNFALVGRT